MHVTNEEVRVRPGQQWIEKIHRERKWRWLGRVIWMDHQCIPQQALHWQDSGRPRRNWKKHSQERSMKTGTRLGRVG